MAATASKSDSQQAFQTADSNHDGALSQSESATYFGLVMVKGAGALVAAQTAAVEPSPASDLRQGLDAYGAAP